MKYDACTDEELIERLRQGETEITDYILEKYKPLVRKYANAMYLIGGETDDLIQEGMIGLFKAIRDFCLDKDCAELQPLRRKWKSIRRHWGRKIP